ncbi:hypothetical protein DEJ17_09770 [Curtobacterium sp. MCSS17_011]|uniref:hypothetical protein n=1 Tax=Curtobacterium sp. MCSS17_011 TaxID=2175643 RepID=UPI000D911D7C|nr:hypothetical protein [Curtobacterium sp. MCSS17_011]PYY57778.1 hypothetical protein DEJ17_09770 [Curtobacterium sp. MCSS17_011]
MAIGDAAAAAGLATYTSTQDRRLGYQNDNQRGDELAAALARIKTLEAQTIGVPKFSVAKSSAGQSLQAGNPTFFTSAAFASPVLNKGGWTWSGGVLTVPRTGVYTVVTTMKLQATDYYRQYCGITQNVSDPANLTAGAFITRSTEYPGDRASNQSSSVSPSSTAMRLAVQLNEGDKLRMAGFQDNYGANTVGVDDGATSLTFEVVWLDKV